MYEKVWVLELTLMHVDIVLPYDRAWFFVHKTLRLVFESKGIWFLFDEKLNSWKMVLKLVVLKM